MNEKPTIGFIGLGTMGLPMTRHLLAAGHTLLVFDLNTEAMAAAEAEGATQKESVREVADQADIVFLSLPDPAAVRAVVLGEDGLVGGKAARIVVDLSTTGPAVEEEAARALADVGKLLLDCPVSGGAAGAIAGKLTLMLAGDPAAAEEIQPLLALFGRCFSVGDRPGQGQVLKVLNNLMSVTALAIGSEALVLGAKAGLDPEIILEVVNNGTGRSGASMDKLPKHVLTRKFDFGFPVALSAKDIRLCLEEADRLGVPMIVGTAVRQLLTITRDRQGPDTDLTALIRTIEEWANIQVRGGGPPHG
ncbi:MAG: NAD(P)-dependent oxidoreductase [Alphaproteobacteria bacterium]